MTTISLSVICGDAGARTLKRLLSSVVYRSSGAPLVDEICIAWNGKDDAALLQALPGYADEDPRVLGLSLPEEAGQIGEAVFAGRVRLRILRQVWPHDFAAARNEALAMCSGDWVLWADADDEIADPGTDSGRKAINDVARSYNLPEVEEGGKGTDLRAALSVLPWSTNAVLAPYDYLVDSDGRAVIRQRMRRVLRRAFGWVWRSPDGVHEIPYPIGTGPSEPIYIHSLLNRHFPAEPEVERLARNAAIIQKLRPESGQFVDARHAADLAAAQMAVGLMDEADASLRVAISMMAGPEDVYRYRIMRSHLAVQRGAAATTGLQEAFAAVSLLPSRREGYFLIAECFFLLGQWEPCTLWYRHGCQFNASPEDVEVLPASQVKPVAQAAKAYCQLGKYGQALALLENAYWPDPMLKDVEVEARAGYARQEAEKSALALGGYFRERQDWIALRAFFDMVDAAPSLRGLCVDEGIRGIGMSLVGKKVETIRPTASEDYVVRFPGLADAGMSIGAGHQVWEVRPEQDKTVLSYRQIYNPTPIVFYAPHGVEPWEPSYPQRLGIGGAESSVIYLAEELARLHHRVTLYCPGGDCTPRAHRGVLWYGLKMWDPEKLPHGAVVISCRAPWLLRDPAVLKRMRGYNRIRVYVWHQDNGYGSPWEWCKEVAAAATGHLFVSRWAGEGLLKAAGLEGDPDGPVPTKEWTEKVPGLELARTLHQADLEPLGTPHTSKDVRDLGNIKLCQYLQNAVIGNGVKESWCDLPEPSDRNPKRVIYASDPTRGLERLLGVWPQVLEHEPEAVLNVYGDFHVAATYNDPYTVKRVYDKMMSTPKVQFCGRVGQDILAGEMLKSGVYAYPGGPMPEGFGVALVQAAACGMIVVAPDEGAIPEVLGPDGRSPWTPWGLGTRTSDILHGILEAMQGRQYGTETQAEIVDRQAQRQEIRRRHGWGVVAERFRKRVLSL